MTLAKQFTLKEKIMFWLMNRFLKTEIGSTKRYQWSNIEKPLRDYDLLSLEPRECENIMVTPRSIILRSPFAFSSRLCLFSAVFFGFEKKKLRDKQVVAARNIALDKDNPTKELLKIYSVRDQFLSEKTQTPTTKH